MIGLFGLAKLAPITLVDTIVPLLKGKASCAMLKSGGSLPDTDVILLLGVNEFLKHAVVLYKKPVIVVIFDCKEQLDEMSNLKTLDDEKIDYTVAATIIADALKNKKSITFKYKRTNPIKSILDTKKSTGFLHTYNTQLYTITNKDVREKLRALIFSRMQDTINEADLNQKVQTITPKRGKAREAISTIVGLINGPNGVNLRKAIVAVTRNKTDPDVAAQKFAVEAYDLRYFLAVIAKSKKENPDGRKHEKRK